MTNIITSLVTMMILLLNER